jgi:hypothetical protein
VLCQSGDLVAFLQRHGATVSEGLDKMVAIASGASVGGQPYDGLFMDFLLQQPTASAAEHLRVIIETIKAGPEAHGALRSLLSDAPYALVESVEDGATLLHFACARGNSVAIELLATPRNVRAADARGRTALMVFGALSCRVPCSLS